MEVLKMEEKLKVIKVNIEDKIILKNLLSLYLHELSKYTDDLKINEEGLFEYDSLDMYFKEEKLEPYFITLNGTIIGFILISISPYSKPGTNFCIQEFFILNKYRKTGLAHATIKEIMKIYKGKFSIFIIKNNQLAINFWRKFYRNNNIEFEENDEEHPHYENCIYHIFNS